MIYALLDIDMLEKYSVSIEEFVAKCKELNVEMIQYRDKNSPIEMKKELISEVRDSWDKTLIVNDFIELIEYADGLHIGQDDLKKYGSIEAIREKIGDKILGLSTHNLKEIKESNALNVDYIGLGAYAKTSTKTDAKTLGKRKIKKFIPYSNKKVAVIGGVKLSDKVKGASYLVIGSDICKSISTQ
jgi:thiamine-phosphate pyrophosphorylase